MKEREMQERRGGGRGRERERGRQLADGKKKKEDGG